MFKILKDNKIIGISETTPTLLDNYEVVEVDEDINDYIQINGEYLLKSENTEYLNEQAEQNRANAYKAEVDNLVAEYMRKKEFNLLSEEELNTLKKEIEDKVAEIKDRYPCVEEKG